MARSGPRPTSSDALSILEYLIHDLIVAHQLYDFFMWAAEQSDVKPETDKAVRRMYVSYLVLALCKLSEFLNRYKSVIPDALRPRCRAIEAELDRRGIRKLRNTFIGHIHNKDTGRPITETELNAAFNAATGNDLKAFLKWVHISGDTLSPSTVVGSLEAVHAALRKVAHV